jgi:hypothetical protein
MPLHGVENKGYTRVGNEPPQEARARTAGANAPRGELRAPDIPARKNSQSVSGSKGATPNVSQLRCVPRNERTPAQQAATKATSEKPSLLRRAFAGVAGFVSGALGGAVAGLYGMIGVGVAVAGVFGSGGEVAFIAGMVIGAVCGAAFVAAGVVGGAVVGAMKGASTGKITEGLKAGAIPVKFAVDLSMSFHEKTSEPKKA